MSCLYAKYWKVKKKKKRLILDVAIDSMILEKKKLRS